MLICLFGGAIENIPQQNKRLTKNKENVGSKNLRQWGSPRVVTVQHLEKSQSEDGEPQEGYLKEMGEGCVIECLFGSRSLAKNKLR